MLASAYTASQIRQWLLDHQLITASGQVLDTRAIYDAAHLYGVLGRELDTAVGYPVGTADLWVSQQRLPPLDGVDRSGYVPPVPAPAPPPAAVGAQQPAPVVLTPAPAPAVVVPVVSLPRTPAQAPAPVSVTPQPVIGVDPSPFLPGEPSIDSGDVFTGTLDPAIFGGSSGGAISKPLLFGVAALAALFLLRKKG